MVDWEQNHCKIMPTPDEPKPDPKTTVEELFKFIGANLPAIKAYIGPSFTNHTRKGDLGPPNQTGIKAAVCQGVTITTTDDTNKGVPTTFKDVGDNPQSIEMTEALYVLAAAIKYSNETRPQIPTT